MTTVISGWRWAVVDAPPPDLLQSAVGVAVALALFVTGLTLFRTTEPKFADML
jgi:ABC-type polysaccharide/polyol phosphate export permease